MESRSNAGQRTKLRASNSRSKSGWNLGWIVAVLVALLFCPQSRGQTTAGQFNGHVVDPSGAVVSDATVTLLDVQTGLSRTATTNKSGLYTFPLVAPGEYKLSVGKPGFSTEVNPPFRLEVNQNVTQDFALKVGSATDTLTVSTNSELIDTTSATLGSVIETRTVADLPLNGRSFTSLLTLAPGINPTNYSQNSGAGSTYGTNQNAVGIPGAAFVYPATQGQWNRENIYYLDGVIDTGGLSSTYDVPPIIDAIQEFKIQSHNDNAEFGGVLGGVVNLVTKSGTNTYHGSGWEYFRNQDLDARNPFSDNDANGNPYKYPFHQNEYGGTFGGPVRIPKLYNGRDKTFFFAAYEGWKYLKPASSRYISPTAAELSGDFTDASAEPYELYNPFTTTGTPGNYTRQVLGDGYHIPSNLIDTTMQQFLTAFADTPNIAGAAPGTPNTLLNNPETDNANELNFRVDQNFGAKTQVWARYSSVDGKNIQWASHLQTTSGADDRNYGGGVTHTFTKNLVLDATVGYSGRWNALVGEEPVGVSASAIALYAGITAIYGNPQMRLGSYASEGGLGPIGSVSHELNFSVNTTWLHGKHMLRWGFEEQIPQLNQGLPGARGGADDFTFSTSETSNPSGCSTTPCPLTGNSLASALLGIPDSGDLQSLKNGSRIVAPSAYIHDVWNVTPKLTVNAGLRWDGESSPHLLDGTVASMMDPNTGNWIISGGKMPPPCNAAAGVYAPCIPVGNAVDAAHVEVAANPNLGPDPVYTDFGPRLGVAYKLGNSTVIRGGYGLIYDNVTGGIQSVRDRLFSWPYNSSQNPLFNTLGQSIQTMSAIVPGLSTINALPSAPTPFTGIGWYYDPHLKNHYSHQWNVEVQKELTTSLVASIAYVGSVDRHLPITGHFNNSPEPGGAGLDRPFPWATTALEATSRGESNFNAMEARVDKRLTHGIAFGTGLTWSKGMDNGAGGLYGAESGPQGAADFQIYNNPAANYGESANSLKFIYYGWGIAELPFGKGKQYLTHGVGSVLLGGWQFNTNISAHSGGPLGMSSTGGPYSGDNANIGDTLWFFGEFRANQSGSAKVSHPTKNEWFNPNVFSSPSGTYGNAGRVSAFGPAFDQVDFSLMKGFRIGERVNIQLRPEFLNVFNIQNYGNPSTGVGAGMGNINGLANGAFARQIQLSVRGQF
jgi:hypothetical protein